MADPLAEGGIVLPVPYVVQGLFLDIAEKMMRHMACLAGPVQGGIAQQGLLGLTRQSWRTKVMPSSMKRQWRI